MAGEVTRMPWHNIVVGLSTASVYPENTEAAFRYAADLGYDGVELMVWAESVSQNIAAVQALVRKYSVPVQAVHAPCLLISQRVWGADGAGPDGRCRPSARPSTPPIPAIGITRWTWRTPPLREWIRSNWRIAWAAVWPTCIWPTVAVRRSMSIYFRGTVISPASRYAGIWWITGMRDRSSSR